jgi:monovalent cation/hydrogen antiporter
MATLELILVLLAAVLISAVIDQLVARVSLPLIQIALGIIIAVVARTQIDIEFDSELFLVLFIAPLLYNDAREVDKAALMQNIKPILALAIGLVVFSALIIGFSVNAIIPAIPLTAAIALGAALGPTDAVAVSSVPKESLDERSHSLLKGESLLNDASGIVIFQFAIAACITGAFSPIDAGVDFLISFFGGLIIGAILGLVTGWVARSVRSMGLENTTFHVLFDLFCPFIIFLIAEQFEASGVIAVVTAGLVSSLTNLRFSPTASRENIVSTSVWRVFTFALNGVVFVLLGTQLPKAMSSTWESIYFPNGTLILFVLGITLVLVLARFVWVLGLDYIQFLQEKRRSKKEAIKAGERGAVSASAATTGTTAGTTVDAAETTVGKSGEGVTSGTVIGEDSTKTIGASVDTSKKTKPSKKNKKAKNKLRFFTKEHIISALRMTLAGAKGTITLSIMLTLPIYTNSGTLFPQRHLIIFLACGVILVTLLLATFVLPLLAPKKEAKENAATKAAREREVHAEILRNVIEDLAREQNEDTREATQVVIQSYRKRIENLVDEQEEDTAALNEIHAKVYKWQEAYVYQMHKDGKIDDELAAEVMYKIEKRYELSTHSLDKSGISVKITRYFTFIKSLVHQKTTDIPGIELEEATKVREVRIAALEFAVNQLNHLLANTGDLQTEHVSAVLDEYSRYLLSLQANVPSITDMTEVSDKADDVQRRALALEIDYIQKYYKEERISRSYAKRLRENIALMQVDLEDKV